MPASNKAVRTLSVLISALLAACANTPLAPPFTGTLNYIAPPPQPEAATGSTAKPGWATRSYAVAAANPLATDAGRQVLAAGGSAVDAAIAVQMVLTLVEPQSSGIGGGAFMLHFDGKTTRAFDGRETAPAGATPALFLDSQGQPMKFADAVVGGRSVGVPGAVAMLARAHAQHGKLPWASLFQPAITLATQGFAVSPRMAALLAAEPHLKKTRSQPPIFTTTPANPGLLATCCATRSWLPYCKALPTGGRLHCCKARSRMPSPEKCKATPPTPAA